MDEYIYLWAQWGILNSSTGFTQPHEKYKKILEEYGNLKTAWKKVNIPFLMQLGFGRKKSERILEIRAMLDFPGLVEKLNSINAHILCIDDSEYPECLRNIPDPPVFLFVRGKLPLLHKSLGVVGTRKITHYGKISTEKFTSGLVRNGFVIVSGLALGVDACAHHTTLKNEGVTVGVLGSGVDLLYPGQNRSLARNMLKSGGAIVSEYPLGTPSLPHHFPARNRIISGLSRGVLIVEGGEDSGALITGRLALEQCREVFAIPNSINNVGLCGTNKLIRTSSAKLVEKVEHILEDFQMEVVEQKQIFSFSAVELELIEHIKNEGKSIDELTADTKYNVAKLSEILITLQLKGVAREVGHEWVLV